MVRIQEFDTFFDISFSYEIRLKNTAQIKLSLADIRYFENIIGA